MNTPTTLPEALTEIEELRAQVLDLARLLGQEAQRETGVADQTKAPPVDQRQTVDRLLREVVEGTAASTGDAFFRPLVEHLAKALNVRYAFVGEWRENQPDKIRMLAVWSGTQFVEPLEYDLMGTPCTNVIRGEFCFYANAVQQLFPKDRLLEEMNVESYCGMPFFGQSANPLGILVVMDDRPMTNSTIAKDLLSIFASRAAAELERGRAERERSQALADLHNVMETIPDILFTLDLRGNLVRWNQAMERATGYSANDLLNKHVLEFVPLSEHEPTAAAIQWALQDGYLDLEGHLLTKDGRTIPFHWTGATLTDHQGHVIGLTGMGRNITERKRQEEEQLRREMLLALMLKTGPGCIKRVALDGTLLQMNPAGLHMIELDEEEAIGCSVFDVVVPEHRVSFIEMHQAVLKGASRMLQFEIQGGQGTRRWMETYAVPFLNPVTGNTEHLAVTHDITERKRTEALLRSSEEKLRQALHASNTGLWEWNTETNDVLFSPEWKRQLGYEDTELPDMLDTWEQRLHPEDHAGAIAYVRAYLAQPKGEYQQEFRLRHKDGTYRWIEARASFVTELDGRCVRLLGSHIDMTGRKQTDLALRASEDRFRAIFDQTFQFIGLMNTDGTLLEANRSSLQFAGLREEDVLGKLFWDTPWWSHSPTLQARLREAVRAATGGTMVRFEATHPSATGELAYVDFSLKPVRNERGEITLLIPEGRDVTDRKRAEQVLEVEKQVFAFMATSQSLTDTLTLLCECCESIGHGMLISVLLLDQDGQHLWHGAAPSLPEAYNRAIDGVAIGPDVGSCGTAAYLSRQVVVADIATDPLWEKYRELALSHGLRSCWSTPIFSKDGRVLGTFAVYYRMPHQPLEVDRQLIDRMAHLACLAIEGEQAEQALKTSDEKLRQALLASNTGLWEWNTETNEVRLSREWKKQLGYEEVELPDMFESWESRLHPDDHDRAVAHAQQYRDNPAGAFRQDFRLRHKDGTYRWIESHASFITEPNGRRVRLLGSHTDITERKQAEKALKSSEERLRQALHASNTGLWEWNTETNEASFSQEWKHQLGYDKDELPDGFETWESRLHPEDRAGTLAYVRGYLAHPEGEYRLEFRLRHKDGSYRWIEARASFVAELDGRRVCLLGSHTDITERKKRDAELRLSKFLIDRNADAVYWIDPNARILDVNEAASLMLGYTMDELCTMTVHDLNPDFTAAMWPGFWAETRQVGSMVLETAHRTKNGRLIPIEVRVNFLAYEGKEYHCAFVRDITVRKQMETERRQSHSFIRQVIDAVPNFIFAKDRDGRFMLVNKALAECYGTTVDELIGKTDADFNSNTQEVEFFRRLDLDVLDFSRERFILEEKVTDSTGKIHWLQTVKRPIFDDQGRAVLVLGASTDITERKRVESELRQREQDLRSAVEERERISEDLHDGILQSIFAVGLGLESCRTLVSELSLPEKKTAASLMAALDRAVGQLNHVMAEVRNFIVGIESHVLQGRDVGSTLRTMVQAMCASKGMACRITIEEAAVRGISTEQAYHVVNIVREALSNSLRHSGADRITLSFKGLSRSVRLSVTDNGKGFIPDSVRDVGHGLANMAARARKLGGRIEVRSRRRKGTKVLLDMPRRPVDA